MSKTITTPPADDNESRWGLLWLLILFLIFATNVTAGVLVAPTVVFVDEKNRTARLDINNPGTTPQEVTIQMGFGLDQSDSLGKVTVELLDSNITDPRAATTWIKAFPRQVVIPPNGTQVVRFVANPPKDLATGEYWARIIVRSKDANTEIPSPADQGAITTKLNMVTRTAIMLKYRAGSLNSEVALTSATSLLTDSSVAVTVDLENKGNASYVGVMSCRLLDANKKEIGSQQTNVAVYRTIRRRVEIPYSQVRPGFVEVSISTNGRTDIPPDDIIPGNKIFSTIEVR